MPSFLNLPQPAFDRVTQLVTPLHRVNLIRAFPFANFEKRSKKSAKIWDTIFKDEIWLQRVSSFTSPYCHPPNPALVGSDLISAKQLRSAYLALVISDWSGDARYEKDIFASFREQDYEYNKERSEVWFRKSRITLHIGDIDKVNEWIEMENPGRLFRSHHGELQTAVLYYHDVHLYKIGLDQIGGVENFPIRRKKRVEHICSLPLRFGDGTPINRVFVKRNLGVKLVQKRQYKNKQEIRSWRVARADEKEWSFVDS